MHDSFTLSSIIPSTYSHFHSTDLSLREYVQERAQNYEKEVPKSMRDTIVKDEWEEFDADEMQQLEKLMWGDVQSIG